MASDNIEKENNFLQEEKEEKSIIQIPKVIKQDLFMAKRTAPFSIAIDKAFNDNKQLILEMDDKQNYTQSALVVYNEKGKHATEIMFKHFFETMPQEQFDEFKKANKLIRDSGAYNTFAKKVKHIFEAKLFEQYDSRGNGWLAIKDSIIADIMKKPQSYISANMDTILDLLSDIQIKSFRLKGKSKLDSFEKVNIIEAVKHNNGTSYLLFGSLYSYYVTQWGFTQYPIELLGTDDRKYKLAFDIGSYIAELKFHNRTRVKVKSIYERVTAIPRYEDVRDNMHRKYQEKIFKPFEDNIEYLNTFATFSIDYENTDYIKANGQYDFDKWLDTTMIINWKCEPNYAGLEAGREKAKKKAKKQKAKREKPTVNNNEQLSF